MKYALAFTMICSLFTAGCATTKAQPKMLEKYPQCYHINPKISQKCVERNENGESTTALQLENTSFPGQYK